MKPANIALHIDELILHGFAPGDRYRIGEAVERELTRLLSEQGVPDPMIKGGEHERLDGGMFSAGPTGKPETIGVQVAQAVHGAIGKTATAGKNG